VNPQHIEQLRNYFTRRDEVLMAFLFGSWAKDQAGIQSDADIAVYLRDEQATFETLEARCFSKTAQEIWADLERMIGREVDLVVLNDAAPSVALSALQGISMVIKDRRFYLDFLLRTTSEAADFREWVESYWQLKQRDLHETPA
jgi:uncharacterized protein